MDGFIVLMILVLFALYRANLIDSDNAVSGPIISTNTIDYPSLIECGSCVRKVEVNPITIDTGTWNIICDGCGEIAYLHPKSEERIQQIEEMLK